jgi:hypothetical protein
MPVLTEDVRLQLQYCIMVQELLSFDLRHCRKQDEDEDTSWSVSQRIDCIRSSFMATLTNIPSLFHTCTKRTP